VNNSFSAVFNHAGVGSAAVAATHGREHVINLVSNGPADENPVVPIWFSAARACPY